MKNKNIRKANCDLLFFLLNFCKIKIFKIFSKINNKNNNVLNIS